MSSRRTLISIPRVLLLNSSGSLEQNLKGLHNLITSINGRNKFDLQLVAKALFIDLPNVVLPTLQHRI
jgi:hypothetical protein